MAARTVPATGRGAPVSDGSRVITAVSTEVLRLPLRGALRWGADSEIGELEHVLVRLQAGEAVWAISEAPVRPTIYGETIASVREAVEALLGPRLLGRDLFDPGLPQVIDALPFNFAARGALDLALHLARAAARSTTLADQIGAGGQSVPVSFILGIDEPGAMVREAERVVEAGVRVLKVKVGRDHAGDLRVLAALDHALAGAGVTVYADANQAYDPEVVLARLSELARHGLAYVEEPLPVHLTRRRSELREASPLPIIADDSCFGPAELERELDFETFEILNIKPARTGVSASLAMMERAAAAGKGVMIGSQAASGLGTTHAATLALRPEVDHPCELAFPLKLARDSLAEPLAFRDGCLAAAELLRSRLDPALAAAWDAPFDGVNMTVDFRRTPNE
jgi:L-alanine-DL-glutamate epimerase-like enolase superfamily enzyme